MKDLEAEIKAFLKEREWDKLRPSDLAKSVSIEAAELLELFQWRDMDAEAVKRDPALLAKLRHELADVMIYCIDMAVGLDLDTGATIREKIEHNRKKYPVEVVRAINGATPGVHPGYEAIKRKYREAENAA